MSIENVVERINNCLSLKKTNPLFVLIAGGSCAGKTTLARWLSLYYDYSSIVKMDDYFLDFDDPALPMEDGRITFDKPESYHFDEMAKDLAQLDQNNPIMCPIYCLEDNKRIEEKKRILPTKVILIEGLYAIRLGQELSVTNKLSIFVNTPYHIRLQRRIDRDKEIATKEVIERFFRNRAEPLYQEYVHPQLKVADTVIFGF